MYKNIWITWLESYETLWRDSTVCLWGWNKIIKITTTKSPRDFIHTGRNLCFSCTPNLKLSSSLTFASGAISVRLLIVVGLICINMHKSSFTFTHALHLNHYTWTNKLKTSFTCFHTKCRFVLCFFFQVLTLHISTRPCLFVCFSKNNTALLSVVFMHSSFARHLNSNHASCKFFHLSNFGQSSRNYSFAG